MRSKFYIIIVLLYVISAQTMTIYAVDWIKLEYDPDPQNIEYNPLRGIIPGFPGTRNFPYSTEHFYIPFRGTMKGMNEFDWREFDANLDRIANEGNCSIFRFYLDYPGRDLATPQFLIDDGVKMYDYTDYGNSPGESKCPDYNDPVLINALINFIQNLGSRYDGDPRIAFIQCGLYGFWGEWHVYPHDSEWGMNRSNKDALLDNYIKSFKITHIQCRDPQATTNALLKNGVGYFDDSFCLSTIGSTSWYFWPKMQSNALSTNWQSKPMGGEIHPSLQDDIWKKWPNSTGQDWQECVTTTHATTILNHSIFDDAVGSMTYKYALRGSKMLGYKFHVSSVRMNSTQSGNINIDIRIKNEGVAPFYYDWDAELAAYMNKNIISLGTVNWNISKIFPGDEVEKKFISRKTLALGNYKLLMHFVNPLSKSRNNAKAIRFANSSQDADKNEWLTVGSFTVDESGIPTELILNQNYPNPFNPGTTITYQLAKDQNIELVIFNTRGQNIRTLVNSEEIAGPHLIEWDGRDDYGNPVASGLYFYIVKTGDQIETRKMLLIR
jgi:hypothetical protein